MQKYILSALVIVAFASYAFYSNIGDSDSDEVAETNSTSTVQVVVKPATTTAVKPIVVKPTTPSTPTTPKTPVTNPVVNQPVATLPKGAFKDGTYTGTRTYNYHGYVQVEAVITNGKLVAVNFLEYPTQDESSRINRRATPILAQEAVSIQSSKVDTVSGATDTSGAFRKSLESALVQARV